MSFNLPNGNQLQPEELAVINYRFDRNYLIKGGPGTGKTVMAIYRAVLISAYKKTDKPVLMLVYNRPLMLYIQKCISDEEIEDCTVMTYHQWIRNMYRYRIRKKTPQLSGSDIQWDEIEADLNHVGRIYEHVIIDEAQDFPIELIRAIKRTADHITCFIDPNQAVEDAKTEVKDIKKALNVETIKTVTKNYRNSKEIRDFSALFCLEGEPANTKISWKKPTVIRHDRLSDEYLTIAKLASMIEDAHIGVVVENRDLNNCYDCLNYLVGDSIDVQMYKTFNKDHNTINFEKKGITILSYGTTKGLDFDAVFLTGFDRIISKKNHLVDMNKLYVATSRAISRLFILIEKGGKKWNCIDSIKILDTNPELFVDIDSEDVERL